MGVSVYAVAAFETKLGRLREARRWIETAHAQTECVEPSGLGIIALVRAARLLGPLLRVLQTGEPAPPGGLDLGVAAD
jgi:hypothetical protein